MRNGTWESKMGIPEEEEVSCSEEMDQLSQKNNAVERDLKRLRSRI
jgi:hypothetical protein